MVKAIILGTAHPHVYGLAEAARKVKGVEVAGVWDSDRARRKEGSEKLGVKEYGDVDEALGAGAALALIGAVPSERAALAGKAVESGANVLVDKPLALGYEALEELAGKVEESRRQVMVYYPYRGFPQVVAAREAVIKGQIGKLVRIFSCGPHKLNAPTRPAWHWTREENGGILVDIGSHHLDLCCYFTGQYPQWLCAVQHNFTQPEHAGFADFAQVQMRFADETFGHVEVDWLNPKSMKTFGDTRIWLGGTKGKIEIRLGDEVSARIWTEEEAGAELDWSGYETAAEWDGRLLEALVENRRGPIDQDEVWQTSRLSLWARESAESDGLAMALPCE